MTLEEDKAHFLNMQELVRESIQSQLEGLGLDYRALYPQSPDSLQFAIESKSSEGNFNASLEYPVAQLDEIRAAVKEAFEVDVTIDVFPRNMGPEGAVPEDDEDAV